MTDIELLAERYRIEIRSTVIGVPDEDIDKLVIQSMAREIITL